MATEASTATKNLTLRVAKELKGKTVFATYYGYAGQDGQKVCKIGSIASQYEFAKKNTHSPFRSYENQAAYRESYMNKEDLEERKNTFLLLVLQ